MNETVTNSNNNGGVELALIGPPVLSVILFGAANKIGGDALQWGWVIGTFISLFLAGFYLALKYDGPIYPAVSGFIGLAVGFGVSQAPATVFASLGTAPPEFHMLQAKFGLYGFTLPALGFGIWRMAKAGEWAEKKTIRRRFSGAVLVFVLILNFVPLAVFLN